MADEDYFAKLEDMVAQKEATLLRLDRAVDERTRKLNDLNKAVKEAGTAYARLEESHQAQANLRIKEAEDRVKAFEAEAGDTPAKLQRERAVIDITLEDIKKREEALAQKSEEFTARELSMENTFNMTAIRVQEMLTLKHELEAVSKNIAKEKAELMAGQRQFERSKKEWMTKIEAESTVLTKTIEEARLAKMISDKEKDLAQAQWAKIDLEKEKIDSQWKTILSAQKAIDGQRSKGRK